MDLYGIQGGKKASKKQKNKNFHVNQLEDWRLLLELDSPPRRSKKHLSDYYKSFKFIF